ncbi:hypothetical protein CHS0354_037110 [Potamilus streckersoni]|uniref:Uncharacterized protein n=1 Tax=Potamilus streckersoni TaxID=2493646 RepID=A0AAE0VGT3_9BIVA|nr:hypothetical protein CHS0354_037110 [Potamilus streckersoni]
MPHPNSKVCLICAGLFPFGQTTSYGSQSQALTSGSVSPCRTAEQSQSDCDATVPEKNWLEADTFAFLNATTLTQLEKAAPCQQNVYVNEAELERTSKLAACLTVVCLLAKSN